MGVALGQLQAVEVGVRDAQVLGLAALPGTHGHVAVRAAREAGIDGRAVPRVARGAVGAEAARDVEGHDHAVALLQPGDALTDLVDDPHVLVAEDDARLRGGTTLVHVEVGPADRGGGDAHDHVVRVPDVRLLHVFDRHRERPLVDDSLHGRDLRSRADVPRPTSHGSPVGGRGQIVLPGTIGMIGTVGARGRRGRGDAGRAPAAS